jgi:hypothetical protein
MIRTRLFLSSAAFIFHFPQGCVADYLIRAFERGEDRLADEVWNDWHNAIAKGVTSLHPIGYPMSRSGNAGFRAPFNSAAETFFFNFFRAPAPPHLQSAIPPVAVTAVGVGHDPRSVSEVIGTNGGSRYAMPFRVIPDRGQASEYGAHSSIKQRCHVLQQRDPWSYHANGSANLPP